LPPQVVLSETSKTNSELIKNTFRVNPRTGKKMIAIIGAGPGGQLAI
jgi:hypothetical protein